MNQRAKRFSVTAWPLCVLAVLSVVFVRLSLPDGILVPEASPPSGSFSHPADSVGSLNAISDLSNAVADFATSTTVTADLGNFSLAAELLTFRSSKFSLTGDFLNAETLLLAQSHLTLESDYEVSIPFD